jgi:hypothetical protein
VQTHAPPGVAISLKNRTPNPFAKLFIDELRAFADPLKKGPARQPRKLSPRIEKAARGCPHFCSARCGCAILC